MLKSNTKKAIENINNYILQHQNVVEYADYYNIKIDDTDIKQVSNFVLAVFYREYLKEDNRYKGKTVLTSCNIFIDYLQGLPSVFDACYYYNRLASDDIASILEESEEEKQKYINKYGESECEKRLSGMIYNQLIKNYDYTLYNKYLSAFLNM